MSSAVGAGTPVHTECGFLLETIAELSLNKAVRGSYLDGSVVRRELVRLFQILKGHFQIALWLHMICVCVHLKI